MDACRSPCRQKYATKIAGMRSCISVPPRKPMNSPNTQNRGCPRSEEHTSELQSQSNLVCRLLLEKKKKEELNEVSCIIMDSADTTRVCSYVSLHARRCAIV